MIDRQRRRETERTAIERFQEQRNKQDNSWLGMAMANIKGSIHVLNEKRLRGRELVKGNLVKERGGE